MNAERGRLLSTIAWRFLRGRRSRLLDGAARSALAATALGVAAMVVAMALITGYRDALQRKLTQGNAAVMAYPLSREVVAPAEERIAELRSVDGVEGVRQVTYGRAILRSRANPSGVDVTLRGVDDAEALRGMRTQTTAAAGLFERQEEGAPPGVLLGRDLWQALAPESDETLQLMALGASNGRPRFRYLSVRAAGDFSSGLSEFDERFVLIERSVLEHLAGANVGSKVLEVLTADPSRSLEVARGVEEVLGPQYMVLDWREHNRELFTALQVQKLMLFLMLGLIVVVSTFNVASSLLLLVRERTRDIGVLAAIGLEPRSLRRLFLLYGGGLSVGGVVFGVAAGSALSWFLTRFEIIRFNSELAAIYFLRSVPLQVLWSDLAAIVVFTLVVTMLACWLPARRLGRTQPAVALRAE